jgi:hypothetical protein
MLLAVLQRDGIGGARHQREAQLGEVVLPQADGTGLVAAGRGGEHEVAATGAGIFLAGVFKHEDSRDALQEKA